MATKEETEAAAATAKAAQEKEAAEKAAAEALLVEQKAKDDAARVAQEQQQKEKEVTDRAAATERAKLEAQEYNLTLGKDSALDNAVLEKTVAIARGLGLSQNAAQRMLEHFEGVTAERLTARQTEYAPGGSFWTEQVKTWEKAALADPDLGGTPEVLAANVKEAQRVFDTFFDPEVKEFLDVTGFGSHPQFLKGFVKLAKAFSEGTLRRPGSGAPEGGRRDGPVEDRFYKKKKDLSTPKE
jgi:hypothetical protein